MSGLHGGAVARVHAEAGFGAPVPRGCRPAVVVDLSRGFTEDDFFDVWPAAPAPTVLIHGSDSPVVTAAGTAEAARTNPGASVVAVPGAGHMVFWDETAAALVATRAALAALTDPSRTP